MSINIAEFLDSTAEKELLRFTTAGSVDDGKSTLIGRLLHDSKGVYEDQLASAKKATSAMKSKVEIDFALLTDGLKAEREQGITIDVAYRYFSTPKRKFIIADTPGHEQYTRNMATGASTANLAIILIDARHGVLTQSKRHSFIASLLGIPHFLIAINKMDLVDYSRNVFEKIKNDYSDFASRLNISDVHFIPISALHGDNVVERSRNMPWYNGQPLLEYLENVYIASDKNLIDLRYPVQYVIRPHLNFRGYAGQIVSGIIRKGDKILIVPSMKTSRVKSIITYDGEQEYAFAPQSVTVTIEDEIDISRGDMIVHINNLPHIDGEFDAMLVWMDNNTSITGGKYLIKHTSRIVSAELKTMRYKVNVNTLRREETDFLKLNEIGRASLKCNEPLFFDAYEKNRATGSFILIDILSNRTVAAGMILDRTPLAKQRKTPPKEIELSSLEKKASEKKQEILNRQSGRFIFVRGSASTEINMRELENLLLDKGIFSIILDTDATKCAGVKINNSLPALKTLALLVRNMINNHLIVISDLKIFNEKNLKTFLETIGYNKILQLTVETKEQITGKDTHCYPEITFRPDKENIDNCINKITKYVSS